MEIKYRFYNTDYIPPILEYGDTSDLKFVERSIGKKKQLSTLLKDKNGKDIYEGDKWGRLIEGFDSFAIVIMHEGKWTLKWHNGSFGDLFSYVATNSGEVIGNIHEHS